MSNLNCKYVKLSNGENIICMTDDNLEDLNKNRQVLIVDPMAVIAVRMQRLGKLVESYILNPWMPLSETKIMELNVSCIISAVDAKPSFREQYEDFVSQLGKETNTDVPLEEFDIEEDLALAQELIRHIGGTDIHEELEDGEDFDDLWGGTATPGRTLH